MVELQEKDTSPSRVEQSTALSLWGGGGGRSTCSIFLPTGLSGRHQDKFHEIRFPTAFRDTAMKWQDWALGHRSSEVQSNCGLPSPIAHRSILRILVAVCAMRCNPVNTIHIICKAIYAILQQVLVLHVRVTLSLHLTVYKSDCVQK
jgi:hypothetical protein